MSTLHIKQTQNSTLLDVINEIEPTLAQGQLITDILLNKKPLKPNWHQNPEKILVLEGDSLEISIESSTTLAKQALLLSKETIIDILVDFKKIADSFKQQQDSDANTMFIQGIDNLQNFLKIIEEATHLLGRPLDKIKDGNILFIQHISNLSNILEKIIAIQNAKDWDLLSEMIENEMLPAIKNISRIYGILEI